MFGVMLDCSRNAVVKPQKVKEFAGIIKQMGYDTLMLYTEDTYEIESQPYFGHLRGKYTKQELKDIDKYCVEIGIELVPCIQTLAHLNQMFVWNNIYDDINDCRDVLLVEEEKTNNLIRDMLKTLSECYTSRKIHLGMDEAYGLGDGKYKAKHGEQERFEILNRHLHTVCDMANEYGFKPMVWSDMFVKCARNMGLYDDCNEQKKQEFFQKAKLPENISLVYWDYYSTEKEVYDQKIKANKIFGREVCFAGGAWNWRGFAPYNAMSITRTDLAFDACRENNIDNIIITTWGDDSAECSPFAILPTLMFAAEKIKGNTNLEDIKKKFFGIVGADFDSFMLLDKMNYPGGYHTDIYDEDIMAHKILPYKGDYTYNYAPTKYLLYNDPFMGIRDYICTDADNSYYKDMKDKLENVDAGKYSYLFESYIKLAEVLSVKSALGIKTRKAYLENNKDAITDLLNEYNIAINAIKAFIKAHRVRWFEENKPHGFDVQDIRLGGIMQRLESSKERLESFASGEIDSIPELEEKVLPPEIRSTFWARSASVNNIGI